MSTKKSRAERNLKFETLQLHVGQENPDPVTDARAVPIYQTSSYVFRNSDHAEARFGLADAGNIYGRLTNPTEDVFEKRIAALEGGVAALAVASGAAAITYTIENLAQNGDHIVAAKNIYGGSYNLLEHTLPQYGITTTFVEPEPEAFEAAIKELGLILGLYSTRPEEEFGSGPDNLWQLDNQQFMVIECKNEATTEFIPKRDCNQLNGSINWLYSQYHGINECYPIMIHPSVTFSHDCSPEHRIRIIDEESLKRLKDEVKNFALSITNKFTFSDVMAITTSLKNHKLIGSMIVDNYTKRFRTK